jgi:hypothetical protein
MKNSIRLPFIQGILVYTSKFDKSNSEITWEGSVGSRD